MPGSAPQTNKALACHCLHALRHAAPGPTRSRRLAMSRPRLDPPPVPGPGRPLCAGDAAGPRRALIKFRPELPDVARPRPLFTLFSQLSTLSSHLHAP